MSRNVQINKKKYKDYLTTLSKFDGFAKKIACIVLKHNKKASGNAFINLKLILFVYYFFFGLFCYMQEMHNFFRRILQTCN